MSALSVTLLELETTLHRPEVRRSEAALESLLAPEFREFGKSGIVYDRQTVKDALLKEQGEQQIRVSGFECRQLADDVALVTYRTETALRSSVWRNCPSGWQLVFHQGTPVDQPFTS